MTILVTGAAGFIGMHTAVRLLERGDTVVGFDNLNDYYDPGLKRGRLEVLAKYSNFRFIKGDLVDRELILKLFSVEQFDRVVHLAAQAGVRYSVTHPHTYADSNLVGFLNVLEGCRQNKIKHLVYASSSSVYGGNEKMPFSESDSVDCPVSLYAATKRANELMAYSYSYLYNIPVTGLRFFTVYGPWGRPDQSLFLFVSALLKKKPIDVFNQGVMRRDFTYIDDVVEGVIRVLDKPAGFDVDSNLDPAFSQCRTVPCNIFNIGNNNPVSLMDFINTIELSMGVVAEKRLLPMQVGDVEETFSDTSALEAWVGFRPSTSLSIGVQAFVEWYRSFYKV